MSNYQHKDNSGSLFKNDKREKETQPNAKGSAVIDGVEYWVSSWTNEGKNGKFQNLKFERKDKQAYTPNQENQLQREGAVKAPPQERPQEPDFDDSLPF